MEVLADRSVFVIRRHIHQRNAMCLKRFVYVVFVVNCVNKFVDARGKWPSHCVCALFTQNWSLLNISFAWLLVDCERRKLRFLSAMEFVLTQLQHDKHAMSWVSDVICQMSVSSHYELTVSSIAFTAFAVAALAADAACSNWTRFNSIKTSSFSLKTFFQLSLCCHVVVSSFLKVLQSRRRWFPAVRL